MENVYLAKTYPFNLNTAITDTFLTKPSHVEDLPNVPPSCLYLRSFHAFLTFQVRFDFMLQPSSFSNKCLTLYIMMCPPLALMVS